MVSHQPTEIQFSSVLSRPKMKGNPLNSNSYRRDRSRQWVTVLGHRTGIGVSHLGTTTWWDAVRREPSISSSHRSGSSKEVRIPMARAILKKMEAIRLTVLDRVHQLKAEIWNLTCQTSMLSLQNRLKIQ